MSRIGPGDALIGLALVALVIAALLPSYRARAFEAAVEDAVADVDRLRTAALQANRANRRWPSATEPGRLPPGTSGAFGNDTTPVRDEYVLQWRLWHRVERVPAPPRATPTPLDADEAPPATRQPGDAPPDSVGPELMRVVRTEGAVVVHSSQELLLAELLRRYGGGASFVRDTTWTLLVTTEDVGATR